MEFLHQERRFIFLFGFFFLIAAATYRQPQIAMWVGFLFAAYSAVANDSIQTIGTFLASNSDKKWWLLWIWIGGIFLATVTYSWVTFSGDVTYQRLTSRGFEEAPAQFKFLQIAAPLFLLILTRLRMPVSTTFLLLSVFATSPDGIVDILQKSLLGYGIAFVLAFGLWMVLSRLFDRWFNGTPAGYWQPIQWVVSGSLWAVWLMQDAANIAVFLPRSLELSGFLAFAGIIFCGLGILLYLRGDKIQQIVMDKSHVTDVRSATVIDAVYASILFYFKTVSVVPMSTTWVFIGLLAGREIAITVRSAGPSRNISKTVRLISRDATYAIIGLIVSILIAIAVNPVILDELMSFILS